MSADRWDKDGFCGSDVCDIPIRDSPLCIQREDANALSVERFIEDYEKRFLPVVIDGIPQQEKWAAIENWTLAVRTSSLL